MTNDILKLKKKIIFMIQQTYIAVKIIIMLAFSFEITSESAPLSKLKS